MDGASGGVALEGDVSSDVACLGRELAEGFCVQEEDGPGAGPLVRRERLWKPLMGGLVAWIEGDEEEEDETVAVPPAERADNEAVKDDEEAEEDEADGPVEDEIDVNARGVRVCVAEGSGGMGYEGESGMREEEEEDRPEPRAKPLLTLPFIEGLEGLWLSSDTCEGLVFNPRRGSGRGGRS